MLFNSIEFLYFLPVVLVLFYLVQHKFRVFVLLLASYYFYMSWNPVYLLLILASTLTDYGAGLALAQLKDKLQRRLIVAASILLNIGLLVYFKYTNFILENLNAVMSPTVDGQAPIELLDILLPVGISFYTFQTLSYTIDVYRGAAKAEKHLGYFALYVCFFPQLVAGPIERFTTLVPQFRIKAKLTRENLAMGARLVLYGFFMKMVIADNIGVVVDQHYGNVADAHGANLLIAAVLYSFQIYCDFHGYSTIAIGVARWFNIELSPNFKSPYFAHSLTDFWRRWHITLTRWFRDYLYYPMGGNRSNKLKWVLAVMVVFIVSGVWHGAAWTFVLWGAIHGAITLIEKFTGLDNKSRYWAMNAIKGVVVFGIVTALWVFFRSPDLESAVNVLKGIATQWQGEFVPLPLELLCWLGLFFLLDGLTRKKDMATLLSTKPVWLRWSVYFVLGFLIMARGGTDVQPFIYFQF